MLQETCSIAKCCPSLAGTAVVSATGRTAVVLILQCFAPATWPILKAASWLWICLPWRRQLPRPADRLASTFCPPIIALVLVSAMLKRVAPDLARTCRFWNRYLPIHSRYLFTKLKYNERRGHSWEVGGLQFGHCGPSTWTALVNRFLCRSLRQPGSAGIRGAPGECATCCKT